MKNPFEKIREIEDNINTLANNRRKVRQHGKAVKRNVKRDLDKMKSKAKEAKTLLKTEGWRHLGDFIDSYENSLEMKRKMLVNESTNLDSLTLELVKIETKLGLLDELRAYPVRCIEEIDNLKKNL